MSTSSSYRYRPLRDDQIRVLTVFRGNFGDIIRVKLDIVRIRLDVTRVRLDGREVVESSQTQDLPESDLDLSGLDVVGGSDLSKVSAETDDSASGDSDKKWGHYEALSYVWGSSERCRRFECIDGSYLEVTESLYKALQYLRPTDSDRQIWADAVCINQADLEERAAQVAIMADIYRSATRVLVWLGEAEPEDALAYAMAYASDACFLLMEETGEDLDIETFIDEKLEREPWCPCCSLPVTSTYNIIRDGYDAYNGLSDRKWFSRLWVYQEAACGKSIEVHCATHHCNWYLLESMLDPGRNRIGPSAFEVVRTCRQMMSRAFDPTTLLLALVMLSKTDCQEAQDRIFAILSITGLDENEALRPDYTLTASEIFRRVVVESLSCQHFDPLDADRPTGHTNINAPAGPRLPHISLFLALAGTDAINNGMDDRTDQDIYPSWVPRFDRLQARAFAKYCEYSWHLGPMYLLTEDSPHPEIASKCSRQGELRIEFWPNAPNVLQILGSLLGTIARVLEGSESPFAYWFDENDDDSYSDPGFEPSFKQWIARCALFVGSLGGLPLRAFKELMHCNSLHTGFDPYLYSLSMRDEPPPNTSSGDCSDIGLGR